jgi:hypothetical protein
VRCLTAIAIAFAAVTVSAAQAEPESYQLSDSVEIHRADANAARTLTWRCQTRLGKPRTRTNYLERRTRSINTIRWVADLWKTRNAKCQKRLRHRTLPATNDWRNAVRITQRVYPGTADWMLSISKREGGYGPWVWYGGRHWNGYHIGNDYLGADTVGGWLQYRYSTFIGHWHAAVKDLKRRGFVIPDLGWARPKVKYGVGTGYGPWLSPLGQALAAGCAKYYGREGCHWCL